MQQTRNSLAIVLGEIAGAGQDPNKGQQNVQRRESENESQECLFAGTERTVFCRLAGCSIITG